MKNVNLEGAPIVCVGFPCGAYKNFNEPKDDKQACKWFQNSPTLAWRKQPQNQKIFPEGLELTNPAHLTAHCLG